MSDSKSTVEEISRTLSEVAGRFSRAGQNTILSDSFGKHVLEIEIILGRCGRESRVLDVGGGMGVNLLCIHKLNPALELHLIDRFEEYTEDNRMGPSQNGRQLMKDSSISVVEQDFWQNPVLPYESGSFDIITCLDVFEHLPGHPLRLLEEMNRVLKKQGTIIISGPNSTALMSRARLLLGRYPYTPLEFWCQDNFYSHYREYNRKEFHILLQKSGFGEIETVMVAEPSSRNQPRKSRYLGLLVTAVVWSIYFVTVLVPGLRPTIYCLARKPTG